METLGQILLVLVLKSRLVLVEVVPYPVCWISGIAPAVAFLALWRTPTEVVRNKNARRNENTPWSIVKSSIRPKTTEMKYIMSSRLCQLSHLTPLLDTMTHVRSPHSSYTESTECRRAATCQPISFASYFLPSQCKKFLMLQFPWAKHILRTVLQPSRRLVKGFW